MCISVSLLSIFPNLPFLPKGCTFSYICRNFCIHEVQIPTLSFISSLFWRLLAQIHTGIFPSGQLTSLLPILFSSYFLSISYTSSISPTSLSYPSISFNVSLAKTVVSWCVRLIFSLMSPSPCKSLTTSWLLTFFLASIF